jgi:hypothetical protein
MRWRMVDRVRTFEPWKAISGAKAVSFEEEAMLRPAGRAGVLPAMLAVESGVELARWLVAASSAFTETCVLDRVDGLRIDRLPGAGETLDLTIEVVRREKDGLEAAFRAELSGRPAVAGGLCFALAPMATHCDPGFEEQLWKELYAAP